MDNAGTSFYVTGGTLQRGAASYVERRADRDLFDSLTRGEFCYVLTSRQMGKSSLMVHTAARLREAGAAVAVLDLTSIGQNLTVEQWYDGLLRRVGRPLELEDELEEFWFERERLGPLERWMAALQEVVLKADERRQTRDDSDDVRTTPTGTLASRLSSVASNLVIFIDEIDAVRSLPFSTDEFFAGIRECYNRRSENPEFNRLTFCLLGVATPSDLIQDTRTTPFNIGHRIELTDFTEAEAAPLAAGLLPTVIHEGHEGHEGHEANRGETGPALASSLITRHSSLLLERVLFWTGGHPYLTQRLCRAVAEDGSVTDAAGVDRLCEALFLSAQAQEQDDNLLFVRERLLTSEADRAALLDLYGQVRRGKRVPNDASNQRVGILRLSGIVRAVEGFLRLRNRIYERVFDPRWIATHMPDAELRRQRAAYQRGLLRATAVAALVVAVVLTLAGVAVTQARRADRQRRAADQQRRLAQQGQQALRQVLYGAQMKLAQQTWEDGHVAEAQALLETWRPEPGQMDVRAFEWRYLWRLCQGDARWTLRGHTAAVTGVAFSPDGRILATSSFDRTIKLWDIATKQEIASLQGHTGWVTGIVFSRDGKTLASASADQTVRLWDVISRRGKAIFRGHSGPVWFAVFSPDGKTLATGSEDHTVKLWDVRRRQEITTLSGHAGAVRSAAFSPDGHTLATSSDDRTVRLWNVAIRREIAVLPGSTEPPGSVAYSPDGRTLASGSWEGVVKLWNVTTRREAGSFWAHPAPVTSVVFSPSGKTLATGSDDSTIKLWDLAAHRELATFRGRRVGVNAVAFSPDGKTLASGGSEGTVKLWDVAPKDEVGIVPGQETPIESIAFSPNGRNLAIGRAARTAELWELASGRRTAILAGHKAGVRQVVFSPDGKLLATGSDDRTVKLWDVASERELATLNGSTPSPYAVAFSPNSKMLAIGCDHTIKLWDRATRRIGATLGEQPRAIFAVAFSPDGKTLASDSFSASAFNIADPITLWDVASRRAVAHLRGSPVVGPLLFSSDRKTLITSGYSGTVKLWDLATKRTIASLKGQARQDMEVAVAPDGQSLATSVDNTVRLWNLNVRQEVAVLKGQQGAVTAVAFSPDGNTLASASKDGSVRLWRAAPLPETDQPSLVAGSGDGRVTLLWRRSAALGYNVYRGPAGARRARLVKLTPQPVAAASFTDRGSGLVNGRPLTYGVAPVYRGPRGQWVEGPLALLEAIPGAAPPGFLDYGINEGFVPGSVDYHPATGEITVRGSGWDVWDTADAFHFLSQPRTGDFQLSVRSLTRPTAANEWSKAGPMIRESLDPGARYAYLMTTPAHGLSFQWRLTTNDDADHEPALENSALRVPITLRLVRSGNAISAEYSVDGGKRFQPAGEPLRFDPPLAKSLYAGLAVTAHDSSRVSEAKFSGLEIRER